MLSLYFLKILSISWSTIAAADASVFVFTDVFADAFTNVFIYVESKINVLFDELRVKNDLIKSLISLKSVRNPVILQTSDTVDPKNLLKEIQKEKNNANKNLVNRGLKSMSLDTNNSNLTEIRNSADTYQKLSFVS